MSKYFTEADYENSLLELFENMGYDYRYAPNIERDFYSPLYTEVLDESIRRLNPTLPTIQLHNPFNEVEFVV